MTLLHLLLVALSVFFVYEIGRALLPSSVPGIVYALLLFGAGYTVNLYVPEPFLVAAAVSSLAPALDRLLAGPRTPQVRTVSLPTLK